MNSKDLNQRLITEFPELRERYIEETSWQEGDETGSHIVFGDVFTPFIKQKIKERKNIELRRIFDFIECILLMDEKYCNEVIAFSVLESLFDNAVNIKHVEKFMGCITLKMMLSIKKYMKA